LLLMVLHASPVQFRTGWFLESVISASLIVLVIRSRKPFFRSRPGKPLMLATFLVVVTTLVLPFTPVARLFDFRPLTISFVILLGGIVALYIIPTAGYCITIPADSGNAVSLDSDERSSHYLRL
jgi:Mg2+-importing ATPase